MNPSSTRTQKRLLHSCGFQKKPLRFIARYLNVEKLSRQSDRLRDSCLAATNDLVGLCSSHSWIQGNKNRHSKWTTCHNFSDFWVALTASPYVQTYVSQANIAARYIYNLHHASEYCQKKIDVTMMMFHVVAFIKKPLLHTIIGKPSDLWRLTANHSCPAVSWTHSEAVAVKLSSHWSLRKSGSCLKVLVFCLARFVLEGSVKQSFKKKHAWILLNFLIDWLIDWLIDSLIDWFIDETTQMICNTQPLPEFFWIWCRRTQKKINKKNIQKIFMLAQVASQKGDQCVFHLCSFETRSLPQNHPTPGLFHPSSCQLWLCISDDTRGFNHLKCKNPVHFHSNTSIKKFREPRAI